MARQDQQADGVKNDEPELPVKVSIVEDLVIEEVTGRAAGTDDDLAALFESESGDHLADGFNGGSDDDTGVATIGDDDTLPVAAPEPEEEAELE